LAVEAGPNTAGNYSVIVSNALGSVTIAPALLQLQGAGGEPAGEPLLPACGAAGLLFGLVVSGVVFIARRTSASQPS